jgi:biotin carboxylase
MGDKARAERTMKKHVFPTVSGSKGLTQVIGFSVMIKL